MSETKKNLIFALSVFLFALTCVFCILLFWDIFGQTNKTVILVQICDAFFITGFFLAAVGLLVFISSTGFFDMLVYGFKCLGELFLLPFKHNSHEKYYDFVERRRAFREASKHIFGFTKWIILFIGSFLIGVSCIFLIFIYS